MDYKSLEIKDLFNLNGQVAALTGASGYLVGTFSRAFGANGVKVALLDPDVNKGQSVADEIQYRVQGRSCKAQKRFLPIQNRSRF
tara:strand:- start:20522 stop:20776 length:255 start_codon:yes stop_codon:yes gene_type:complete